MKKETTYLIIVITVAIIGGIIFYFYGKASVKFMEASKKEDLAICLSESNVKVYCSLDCVACERQKEIFGDAFSRLDWIECSSGENWSEECITADINDVPTWSFPKDLEIKNNLLSCSECVKESEEIFCRDYCYEISSNDAEFYVAGFIDLEKLGELSKCLVKKR